MKSFSERNPMIIGAVGLGATLVVVLAALQYDKLPFFSDGKTYSAYFAEAGGLRNNANVQVSGYRVGQVSSIRLDGPKVLVTFKVAGNIRLGDRTEAAIKTNALLGTKILEVTPRGQGWTSQTIPLERTTSPYQLSEALGDLTKNISGLDTDSLSASLTTLAQTFKDTPPDVRIAVEGIARFSQALDNRDLQLRNLLANANKASTVLAKRTDQIVELIGNTNALLASLLSQSSALDQIANNVSALSKQLSALVAENRAQLRPALDKLSGVLTILDNRKDRIQKSIKLLNAYAMSLGESVSSGPFFNAYLVNLLPGQFVQPFIDAAFSDLGLDPHVLLPSQRTDPQTGQPGTPPLPLPYPRTGQGGEPRRTLPDAITGNPGDHPCPLPGPGCYPYREPPAPPPPGGPPPGPPAFVPPAPTPEPVYVPAPGEVAPSAAPAGPPAGASR
ncbi:mammalian cell entry protein [Mycobacterium sp. E342]|uniref:MCE family protein n=1 Tax=unclassified Mycobacterium TaxID=2642494 RepID=UPI0008017B35|nr:MULTISPECIES: MCE family protein [unclassified Mycobacterium]OBH18847.1 mammalian cell entry protein [Mycobacterium sp. E3247]OBH38927.1 mammalian cell entry protein [Mycobacterium sp. E342]